jgi:hypothetical protein
VLERAGHDIGAAADRRLQRLRAARKIGDLDVESFVLEVVAIVSGR